MYVFLNYLILISYRLSTQTLVSSLGPRTTTSIFSAAQNLFTVWIRNRFTGSFNFIIYILCNLCENRRPVEIFILSHVLSIYNPFLYISHSFIIRFIPVYFSQCVYNILLYINIANMHILFLTRISFNTTVFSLYLKWERILKQRCVHGINPALILYYTHRIICLTPTRGGSNKWSHTGTPP